MKKINLLLAALVCGCTAFAGDLYDDLANTPEQLKKWQGNLKVAKLLPNGGPEGKYAVEINCDKNTQYGIIRFNLPVNKVKGKKIEISAKVKAENVATVKKVNFVGVKFMLFVQTADGKRFYPEGASVIKSRTGSYDWKEIETKFAIPANATIARVELGLQEASGKVLFSDIDVEIDD